MPCDEDEFERLHIQHYICRFIWQKNYSAPIKEKLESGGALILDVGCGPGTWVIEMANEFPKSHYTGIDICPIYPRDQIPPNVNFLECNILDGLPYHNNTFDHIHVRYLITAFSELDWQIALKELVRVTKVGGIIEIVEDEIEPRNDGPISRLLFSAFFSDLRSRNIDFTVFNHMIDMLLATQQLEDLKLEEISAPFGKWAGRIGTLLSENTGQIFRTFRSKFSSTLGLEQEEYDKLVEAWYNELNEIGEKTYLTLNELIENVLANAQLKESRFVSRQVYYSLGRKECLRGSLREAIVTEANDLASRACVLHLTRPQLTSKGIDKGAGKSTLVNLLLGESHDEGTFKVSAGMGNSRNLTIVDTPGIFDTNNPDDITFKEIARTVHKCVHGVKAILFVFEAKRFTEEQRNVLNGINIFLGEGAMNYMITVFSHATKKQNQDRNEMQEAWNSPVSSFIENIGMIMKTKDVFTTEAFEAARREQEKIRREREKEEGRARAEYEEKLRNEGKEKADKAFQEKMDNMRNEYEKKTGGIFEENDR
ncbi:9351_t:CDS:10 [Diversispora eburnea]|uniref:9351_t:CDS:1 n=1 Tax=Diversispora eburnea TaxID=1213867 RepID=A0A9N8V2X2_9GLOM|nr:9351_t:CDS:10 [Diversispora eburnea]